MHGIGTIGAHSMTSAHGVGANASANAPTSGLPFASLTNAASQPSARGVSSTAFSSLGSQSVSTLLQTQDLSQLQARGGGHGGGGHHGMKMTPSLEAEEAAEESEEERKKLTKTITSSGVSDLTELDENGEVAQDAEQTENNNRPDHEGAVHS
jgi:hypothetical protein